MTAKATPKEAFAIRHVLTHVSGIVEHGPKSSMRSWLKLINNQLMSVVFTTPSPLRALPIRVKVMV